MERVTRKAVLIGCPGGGDTVFLSGVRKDLKNMSDYLQSEGGGDWYESEINVLDNPSKRQLEDAIEIAVADYVFIYFSGHGYTEWQTKARMICFKTFNLPDIQLLNSSPRQLILIDACRDEVRPSISGIPSDVPQWDYFGGSPVRGYFNRQVENSPPGKIIIHGTQNGQASYDSRTGGCFTNAVLSIGLSLRADKVYTQASILDILGYVPKFLKAYGNDQVPCIVYNRGNLLVPFAFGIPNQASRKLKAISALNQTTTIDNSSDVLLGLGILALGIAILNSK